MVDAARKPDAAIVGLGITEQGRRLGVPPRVLRRQALELALTDAGLTRTDVDGYVLIGSGFEDLRYLGLSPTFSFSMQSGGATPILSVIMAAGAIATGQATVVACVYGEAFTSPRRRLSPASVSSDAVHPVGGHSYGYPYLFGMVGPAASHALHARRHMALYGTTSEHMGAVAVAQRAHASVRPGTLGFGQPITLEDHQSSRMIVDPFRLFDCCRDTDGGVAIIVTTVERSRDMAGIPVDVLGAGTGHNIRNWHTGQVYEHHDDIAAAAARAFGQAGIGTADVDVAEFYDPFTISVIMQLEDYGFCGAGEGGPFVASGATTLEGVIPTNTGGGQLSGFYATGFVPLSEAVLQLRNTAPSCQVPGAEIALVSGHGGNAGIQNTWAHGTLVLGGSR